MGIDPYETEIVQGAAHRKDKVFRVSVISSGDPLEIYTEKDGEVIFKKYSPMGDLTEFAAQICESMGKNTGHIAAVCDRDAIIAVYPFTPQPIINEALLMASDIPVFTGVGGGLTKGHRVVNLAMYAEMQGAMGVVVNVPTSGLVISRMRRTIDIPIVVTVANHGTDYARRIDDGAAIFNVAAGSATAEIVAEIRAQYPDMPIMATGGPSDESILRTIDAGANAITYTPPSSAELFKHTMERYRMGLPYE